MSLNHIIDDTNPYADDEGLLNIRVGNISYEYANNRRLEIGVQFGGTTLTASDPAITGTNSAFYFSKGSVSPLIDNTFTLKLSMTISAPVSSHKFYVDILNTKISHTGTFNALQFGHLCSETAIPALLCGKIENNGTNNVRLHFYTADGSTLVVGSYDGTVSFII
jgi:hypothetical protein